MSFSEGKRYLIMQRGLWRRDDAPPTGVTELATRYSLDRACAASNIAPGTSYFHEKDAPEFAPRCTFGEKIEAYQRWVSCARADGFDEAMAAVKDIARVVGTVSFDELTDIENPHRKKKPAERNG